MLRDSGDGQGGQLEVYFSTESYCWNYTVDSYQYFVFKFTSVEGFKM